MRQVQVQKGKRKQGGGPSPRTRMPYGRLLVSATETVTPVRSRRRERPAAEAELLDRIDELTS